MGDLSEFLNARLTETEKIARNCWGDDQAGWWHHTGGEHVADDDGATVCEAVMSDEAIHIARWDPAHVMAWCAAVRAVVHQSWSAMDDPWTYDMMARYLAKEALLEFARIWSAHPDFNPAWRRV